MRKVQMRAVGMMLAIAFSLQASFAAEGNGLPTYTQLATVLKAVVAVQNGGFGFNMWATVVDRDGVVRAVAFSGNNRGDQYPGSRVISAQKANTANAFSLPELALSTAQLYAALQPGGSLFGLDHGNPVDTDVAYGGATWKYGTLRDPMVGKKIGGTIAFGGGLPLYDSSGKLIGAIGVSGDTSCADHVIAWRVRDGLNLDHVPDGVSATKDDNIVFDIKDGASAGGWGHPSCSPEVVAIAQDLPKAHPVGVPQK